MKILTLLLSFFIFFLSHTDCFAAIEIQSKVNNDQWITKDSVYPLKGDKISLKVKKMPEAKIRWYQIIPDISKIYKNANHPWEKDPYKWVGLAKITYQKKELTQFINQWEINPFRNNNEDENKENSSGSFFKTILDKILQRPQTNSTYYQKDVGSFWFQAVVEKDGKKYRSPGIEDSDKYGISPKVFRISIREQEGYLGYLTSFFNVPALFGSTLYQSTHYIGVDCADVLIASYGKWKNKTLDKNYNVGMVINKFNKISECEIRNGHPSIKLKWGKDIFPGDIIAVRYFGKRQYQHIGALYSDKNRNSILDQDDLVIHAGPYPLHTSALSEGKFDGHVIILRPD
jgi:hypothetical protein